MENASIILALLDVTDVMNEQVEFLKSVISNSALLGKSIFALLNKIDRVEPAVVDQFKKDIQSQVGPKIPIIAISAKMGSHLEELHSALTNMPKETRRSNEVSSSNLRSMPNSRLIMAI